MAHLGTPACCWYCAWCVDTASMGNMNPVNGTTVTAGKTKKGTEMEEQFKEASRRLRLELAKRAGKKRMK